MTSSLVAEPTQVAADIVAAHRNDPVWLDMFAQALEQRRSVEPLTRVLAVWGLNQTEAAAALGVTRQAVSKWLAAGVPGDRTVAMAELSAATDLLVHHIKRERIPAVVRRSAPNLGGRSLLDVLADDGARSVLDACRSMFSFEHANP